MKVKGDQIMNDNEIEEKLRRLTPEQLLESIQDLSKTGSLTGEQRHKLHEVSLMFTNEIRKSKEAAEQLLRERGKQLLELASQLRKNDSLTSEERQEWGNIAAMIAGYLMSSWLPRTLMRKILMFLFLAVGVIGVVQWSLWFGLLIIVGISFSPRMVGEFLLLVSSHRK